VLRSRKEPHLLVGARAGAGAVTRCGSGSGFDGSGSDGSGSDGSGSDGSGSDNGIKHGWELKIDTKCNSLLPIQFIFSSIKIVQNHMNKIV
jgi:hypothetical protein